MATDYLRIAGAGEALVLSLSNSAVPEVRYWGPDDVSASDLDSSWYATVPHGLLDCGEPLDCFPEYGRGFSGHAALICRRASGAFISQLRLVSSDADDNKARIVLADPAFGIEITICYALHDISAVLEISTSVTNSGSDALGIDWIASAVLPSPHDELMLFDGRWAREFQTTRLPLQTGLVAKENRSGRTSHHAPPFLFAGSRHFGEEHGEVLALHLGWSGNHRIFAERLRDGRTQLQAGELFLPGELVIEPSQSFQCAKAYAARSNDGLNGITRRLHSFVRNEILENRLAARPRPVHFNSWEAVYFAQDLTTMKELATSAAKLGVERFVVDDGWFMGRNDDTAALGDWTADTRKYPGGLAPLIAHVRELGMEFGLWVEPEMASQNSDLLRNNPHWILGTSGREQPTGRNQYVLDLTREDVFDAIFAQLDALLNNHRIDYLKWDMNRDLTHPVSSGRPAVHAQTKAVYALIDKLRERHSHVEIESCSSGGARADFEILRRTDRIWTSDCNDPIERQRIQRGFSIVFPPEVMGAHVGPRRSHTTARSASMQLRALTALFGHMGIEGDVRAFSQAERAEISRWIAFHKRLRSVLHGGVTRRLEPRDEGAIAFMVERNDALVSYAQLETPAQPTQPPLRLSGLVPSARYQVRLINPPAHPGRSAKIAPPIVTGESVTMHAVELLHRGLPLPVLKAGEIAVFQLQLKA